MQSAAIAENIKTLKDEIETIEQAMRIPEDQAPRLFGSKSLRRSPHPAATGSGLSTKVVYRKTVGSPKNW
jgi:hypothetical protein